MRKTIEFDILTNVITRAPADLPFALLEIASRILKKLLPRAMPIVGFMARFSINSYKSAFNEGCFLAKRLNYFSKTAIEMILKFI